MNTQDDEFRTLTVPEKIEAGIATQEEIFDYADEICDRENDK